MQTSEGHTNTKVRGNLTIMPLSSVGRTIVQVCAVRSLIDEEPGEVEDSQRQIQDVVVVELNDHDI